MNRLTHKARYEAGYKLNKGVQAWQAADMLGAYENTGLTPVEIMEGKLLTGWIPVSERLPEEGINPVTCDFYEYEVTFKSDNIYDVRHYAFGRGHWWDCGQCMDEFVIAWRERQEPYKLQNLAYADNDTAQPGLQSAT